MGEKGSEEGKAGGLRKINFWNAFRRRTGNPHDRKRVRERGKVRFKVVDLLPSQWRI